MRPPIHASSSGDRWYLCRGEDSADVFVFHEPNEPSGGSPSRIALAEFLGAGVGSPERQALLVMFGSLVEAGHGNPTSPSRSPEPGAADAEPTPGEAADPI